METEYCDKCGLLHDFSDGDCLGCKLTDKIKSRDEKIKGLEAQIEKMKCCANCLEYTWHCSRFGIAKRHDDKCGNWKMKE